MSTIDPKRGEVWIADLEPARGAEMKKTRTVLVMNPDSVGRLPLRIVVPITEWQGSYEKYSWMTRVDADRGNGLTKASSADAFQVRSISLDRFKRRLGSLRPDHVDSIAAGVALCVGWSGAR